MAGRSTETLPGAENLFLPLLNGEKVIGVVGIAIDTRKLSARGKDCFRGLGQLIGYCLGEGRAK